MKIYLKTYFVLTIMLLCCYSCSNDDEPIDIPVEAEEVRLTDESNIILVNTKDVEIGNSDDDIIYSKHTEILASEGMTYETTLDCYGMCAAFTDADSIVTSKSVEKVTLINRGKITVHTKYLYERYKDLIQVPEDTDRPYKYLRFIVMYAGKNCTVLNEGTIDVYFDHDPNATSTIYTIAMSAEEGSTIINKGDIHFHGNGSLNTRMRSIAGFADNLTTINDGNMTVDVEMANDTRMITSGGTWCNIINNKLMKVKVPGAIECMTRFGDSNLVNNGTIDLTSPDIPEAYAPQDNGLSNGVSALYEGMMNGRTSMPAMINRGTINLSATTTKTKCNIFGMFCDMVTPSRCRNIQLNIVNEGKINFSNRSAAMAQMAEASFMVYNLLLDPKKCYSTIKMGKWKTTLRDFNKSPYLFYARGVKMDFTGGELILERTSDYTSGTPYSVAATDLLINENPLYVYEVKGYDNLLISSSESEWVFNWNKENQTASFLSDK